MSSITGGLDNIRGMEFVNNRVYVSNAGTENSAPGEAIVTFDPSGNNLGFFATDDPFDVFTYQGELLVSDIDDNEIERYDLDGNFLGIFNQTSGINFPQQIHERTSNGNVLVGGFSTPGGVYEYDSNGTQVALYDADDGFANRLRAAYELGNGNILWSGGDGIVSTQIGTGAFTDIYTVNTLSFRPGTRFIDPLNVPEPSLVLGILIFGAVRAGSAIRQKSQ